MKSGRTDFVNSFKDQRFRRGVIASVVASVIFMIFIQPILKFLWSLFISLSELLYEGYLNYVYRNAAMGPRNYLDVIFFMFLILPLIYPAMDILAERAARKRAKKALLYHSKMEDEQHEELHEAQVETTRSHKVLAKREKQILSLSAIMVLTYLLFLTGVSADLQLNTSFQQRLTALGPVLSVQEEKELRAKWALMQDRTDYLEILSRMDSLANYHHIHLPDPLLR